MPFLPLTKEEATSEKRNHNCMRRTNHSLTARMRNYPFNLSHQIQFISFDGRIELANNNEFIFIDDEPLLLDYSDTAIHSHAKEIKLLTFSQIDTLTNILYNYGFTGSIRSQKIPGCYDPRNGILFLDDNGKALAFVEICFECLQIRESNEKILLGQMCDQKLDMLKNLFRTVGIKYGID